MDVTGSAWRTSSYSGSNGGACIEVGTSGPAVAVRDSKHPDGQPIFGGDRALADLRLRAAIMRDDVEPMRKMLDTLVTDGN